MDNHTSRESVVNPFRIRSWLFVPAVKERFFEKIMFVKGDEKPDVIIFDLEDSVHSDHKDRAREILKSYLHDNEEYRKEFGKKYISVIRANAFDTDWFKDDMDTINIIGPDFFGLSKVESPDEIKYLREKSNASQFFVPIETIKGFRARNDIMKELSPYDVLVLGYEDLSSELMIERPDLDSMNPLTKIILRSIVSAREEDVIMIDAVSRKYGTPENIRELEKECLHTYYNLGMSSKVGIHPSQISVINRVFDKRPILRRGENVLGKFRNLRDGSFVITNGKNEMMDTPSYRLYSKILELWNMKCSRDSIDSGSTS
jgi:citrate lyase subunit beta/citryl-CoA lyase